MDLSYPIGKFRWSQTITPEMRPSLIADIAAAPELLREAVHGLKDDQLDMPYRPGGWTVRQVVHHVADSHMHSNIRMRFALTSNEPTIMPYDESVWAQFPDARNAPVETSLQLLENLHHRWVTLLKSLSDADFARTFRHPELGLVRLDTNTALYAWHGRHHTAHITRLRDRMSW
jgi:DinB superfamily